MKKYRKRPLEVEAMRVNRRDFNKIIRWINESGGEATAGCGSYRGYASEMIRIHTREGIMSVGLRGWVIRGVAGEFYGCDPDVFAATYEVVGQEGPVK